MNVSINCQVDEAYAGSVDRADLQAMISATLLRHVDELGEDVEVAVRVTSDDEMRAINLAYRGIDAATDVLSFAAEEESESQPPLAMPPELAEEVGRHLGDIVIAYPYAERQAAQFGNSVATELRLLAIHGTLHLLGYDHAEPGEEEAMWAEQEAILAPYGDAAVAKRKYPDEPDVAA